MKRSKKISLASLLLLLVNNLNASFTKEEVMAVGATTFSISLATSGIVGLILGNKLGMRDESINYEIDKTQKDYNKDIENQLQKIEKLNFLLKTKIFIAD